MLCESSAEHKRGITDSKWDLVRQARSDVVIVDEGTARFSHDAPDRSANPNSVAKGSHQRFHVAMRPAHDRPPFEVACSTE